MIKLAYAIATWFGCGYFPKGPGTVGSLAAVALTLAGVPPGIAAALFFLPAVWAAGVVAKERGEDPQIVVADEVIGQWIALAAAPAGWKGALAAFLLFRFFDIVKPWPIRLFERLPGGWGVILDDVAAGAAAALPLAWFNRY